MPTIAVAATFSCEPVGKWLSFWLEKLGVRAEIRFAPYGTLQHELVKPTAAVRRADAFVALLCLSDWQRGGTFDSAKFDDDLALFVSSLRGAVEQLPYVALVLCPARPSAQQTKFSAAAMTLRALELPRLRVLDARELAGAYAVCEMHDVVADELGHVPYTDEMWCALGAICSRGVLPALAPPLKVVVVDCDYTLWHGAVGELGPAGVSVEPRHAQLQARLIDLRERGVLIALCSRNEEADVWAAFESASGMLLSREHVSAFRIAPALAKGAAVRALCVELRCAADHVIFVDDNPAEVAAVRAALPAAACWVFPQTHAEAKAQLPHVWRLEVPHAAPSAEDGARAASLAAAARGRRLTPAGSAVARRVPCGAQRAHRRLLTRRRRRGGTRAPPPAARAYESVQYVEATAATARGARGGGGRRHPRRRPIRRLRARRRCSLRARRRRRALRPFVLHVVPGARPRRRACHPPRARQPRR